MITANKNSYYLQISQLTSSLQFLPRPRRMKTAALIRQKQARTQEKQYDTRPEVQLRPHLNINLLTEFASTPLKMAHLSHYDAFSVTVYPLEPQYSRVSSNARISEELCELQKQNYRLIESNYNLLARHAATIEFIRHSLMESIMMVQECHYVHAIKVLYTLLDRIRNITTNTSQSQNKPNLLACSPPGLKERACSVVEEYQIFDYSSPQRNDRKFKHQKFGIVSHNVEVIHFPEPKSQFLELKDQGRFIHVAQNQDTSGQLYPELLTPNFRSKAKNNMHAYSLKESYDFHIESQFESLSQHHHFPHSVELSERTEQPESSKKSPTRKSHILERSEYGINTEVHKKSPLHSKKHNSQHQNNSYHKFGARKAFDEKIEDLYRVLLLQASVLQYEALSKDEGEE